MGRPGEIREGVNSQLIVELYLPPGLFRLALYMREHRVSVEDLAGRILARTPRRRAQARYNRFLVAGPRYLRLRLHKDESLSTLLHALFLDQVQPPLTLAELGKLLGEPVDLEGARTQISDRPLLLAYDQLAQSWQPNPATWKQQQPQYQELAQAFQQRAATIGPTYLNLLRQGVLWQVAEQRLEPQEAHSRFHRWLNSIVGLRRWEEQERGARPILERLQKFLAVRGRTRYRLRVLELLARGSQEISACS